jgi:hypothetical protein
MEFEGKIISTKINDLAMMCFSISEVHGLKACLFGSYQMQMWIFAKYSLNGRNANTIEDSTLRYLKKYSGSISGLSEGMCLLKLLLGMAKS